MSKCFSSRVVLQNENLQRVVFLSKVVIAPLKEIHSMMKKDNIIVEVVSLPLKFVSLVKMAANSWGCVFTPKYGENFLFQRGYVSGDMPFTDVGLETAKSSLTFEIIEEEKTVGDVSEQSLLSYYRDVTQTYNK